MRDSKVYICKGIKLPKIGPLRRIVFVFRQKEWYDKNAIALWWNKRIGTGIIRKPKHQFKYFMVGISFFNLRLWLDFHYIGKKKTKLNTNG